MDLEYGNSRDASKVSTVKFFSLIFGSVMYIQIPYMCVCVCWPY